MKYKNLALKLAGLTFLFGSLSFSVNAMERSKGYSSVEMSDLSGSDYNSLNADDLQSAPVRKLNENVKIKTKADLTAVFIDLLKFLGFEVDGYNCEFDFNRFLNRFSEIDFKQLAEVVVELEEKFEKIINSIKNNDPMETSRIGRELSDLSRFKITDTITNRVISYSFYVFTQYDLQLDNNSYTRLKDVLESRRQSLKMAEKLIRNYVNLSKKFDENKVSEGVELKLDDDELNSKYEKIRAKFSEVVNNLSKLKFINFQQRWRGLNLQLVNFNFVKWAFERINSLRKGLYLPLLEGNGVEFKDELELIDYCCTSSYNCRIKGPVHLKDLILNAGGRFTLKKQLDDVLKVMEEFLKLCIDNDYGNMVSNWVLGNSDLKDEGPNFNWFEKAKVALKFQLNLMKSTSLRGFYEEGKNMNVVNFPVFHNVLNLKKQELDDNIKFSSVMRKKLGEIISFWETKSSNNVEKSNEYGKLLSEFRSKIEDAGPGRYKFGNYIRLAVHWPDNFDRIDAISCKQLKLLEHSLELFEDELKKYCEEYLKIMGSGEGKLKNEAEERLKREEEELNKEEEELNKEEKELNRKKEKLKRKKEELKKKKEEELKKKKEEELKKKKEGTSKTKTSNESHDYDYEEGFYTDYSTYHLFS